MTMARKSKFAAWFEDSQYIELGKFFGDQLRECRTSRGLTQHELGFLADVNQSYISSIEAGRRVPSLDVLVRLFTVMGRKTVRVQP